MFSALPSHFVSLNARNLRLKRKRYQLVRFFRQENVDVAAIQETKLASDESIAEALEPSRSVTTALKRCYSRIILWYQSLFCQKRHRGGKQQWKLWKHNLKLLSDQRFSKKILLVLDEVFQNTDMHIFAKLNSFKQEVKHLSMRRSIRSYHS